MGSRCNPLVVALVYFGHHPYKASASCCILWQQGLIVGKLLAAAGWTRDYFFQLIKKIIILSFQVPAIEQSRLFLFPLHRNWFPKSKTKRSATLTSKVPSLSDSLPRSSFSYVTVEKYTLLPPPWLCSPHRLYSGSGSGCHRPIGRKKSKFNYLSLVFFACTN